MSLEQAVLGHVLPDIGKRSFGVIQDNVAKSLAMAHYLTGPARGRVVKALTANAARTPQAVVKRIAKGGCKTRQELKRQLDYVTRDDGVQATWMNQSGIERSLYGNTVETTVDQWSSGWRGNPMRGHTDHIVLSFPEGTDGASAEAIAREWGRAVFASGDFGDQWRYIAGLHEDTGHYHAHFVVDKRGIDHGQFMSISNKADLNYGVMRELQAEIANAHGVEMTATSRLSRGIVDHAPRDVDYRIAHAKGAQAPTPPMSDTERRKRETQVQAMAKQYASLARSTVDADFGGDLSDRLRIATLFTEASETLQQGLPLLSSSSPTMSTAPMPSDRLTQAQAELIDAATETWADIQASEPGADRVDMEREFTYHTLEMPGLRDLDPFFEPHFEIAGPDTDPFASDGMRQLNAMQASLDPDSPLGQRMAGFMTDLRDQLEDAFAPHADTLRSIDTNPEEMAARIMQPDRTMAQIEAWREQGYDRAAAIDAIVRDDLDTMREDFQAQGYDDARILDELNAHMEKAGELADQTVKPDAIQAYMPREAQFADQARQVIDDFALPPNVEELVAREQILQADGSTPLSDIPALERIVSRVADHLSSDAMQDIQSGDTSALEDHVSNPTIRNAVASELRTASDIVNCSQRQSRAVQSYQSDLKLGRSPRRFQRDHSADIDDDYGL